MGWAGCCGGAAAWTRGARIFAGMNRELPLAINQGCSILSADEGFLASRSVFLSHRGGGGG